MSRALAACLACLVASACSGGTTSPTSPVPVAGTTIIGFNNVGSHGSALAIHRESGYVILPYGGNWTVSTSYGHLAPFIQFVRQAAEDTTAAEIRITADGSTFPFTSVDLYSSVTTIPYSFAGFLGATTVFTTSGTVPNTFGNFATVLNPYSREAIDGLAIRLSNPSTGCCSNPMGLDNIVVGY